MRFIRYWAIQLQLRPKESDSISSLYENVGFHTQFIFSHNISVLVYLYSIMLTTYDIVERLIAASEKEFQTITEENRNKQKKPQ